MMIVYIAGFILGNIMMSFLFPWLWIIIFDCLIFIGGGLYYSGKAKQQREEEEKKRKNQK